MGGSRGRIDATGRCSHGCRSGGGAGSAVVEVSEPEAEPLDVLDDQVGPLGGGVGEPGAVPAQDRGFPAGDGAGQAFELGHFAAGAVLVEGDEPPAGLGGVGGEVGVPQQFLGQVGGADLAFGGRRRRARRASGRSRPHRGGHGRPGAAAGSGRAGRRCGPVTEGVVLGAAADVIERRVGGTDDMEVVDHHSGGGQALGDGGGVGLVGVDHHMAGPG
jgi:hypothetical protein